VFGPQKGLRPDDFTALEAAVRGIAIRVLEHMGLREESAVVHLDEPGGGAAGGIGFGLRALFRDSRFVNGFGLVRGWLQLDRSIVDADWIVTGEGALDASSLRGKGAVALLRLAGPAKHVTILAGKVDHAVAADLKAAYPRVEIVQLAPDGWPLEQALAATADNIRAQVLACASSQQA
jgi:glycerate kinase